MEKKRTDVAEKADQPIARRASLADSAQSREDGLHPILKLQETLGNRRVVQLIRAGALTPEGKITGLQQNPTIGTAAVGQHTARAPMTIAEAGGGHIAQRVGVDAPSVRIHESGVAERMGARAVTIGRDIHFAKNELRGPDADYLVGHELAHVAQQTGEAASVPAAREGSNDHTALEVEADRVGRTVARGGSVRTIVGRAPAGAAQKFDSYEHKDIGDEATKGIHGEIKTVELAPDYRVTYGEMVALAGDYFGSISEVRAIAAVIGKGEGTREEIDYIRRVDLPNISHAERDLRAKEFSEGAVTAAEKRYYKLATRNASHFANPETGDIAKSTLDKSKATHLDADVVVDSIYHITVRLKTVPNNAAGYYRMNHLQAIGEAVAAGKAQSSIDGALAANAFSDHFLTDSFSAGHNRTARTSISEYWNPKEPMFFYNFKGFLAEKLAYYINDHTLYGILTVDFLKGQAARKLEKNLAKKGMPGIQFGDLVSGTIHDYDNEKGIAVKVDGADKKIFGDDNLEKGDTKDVVVRAVQASVADIEAAYEAGKAGQTYDNLYARIAPRGLFRAEELMPIVKPDAELALADRSIKWDYADVSELMADPKFREGLKIFLKAKKNELADVGKTLDADARAAFENAILAHMEGEEGIKTIWQVLQWTPNTGGGILGHNQDDNALDYFNAAKAASGGLASLMWSARANLIQNLVDGYTSGDEEDAIFELLTSCSNDSDVRNVIHYVTWARLENEVGERFSKRYPKAQYGK